MSVVSCVSENYTQGGGVAIQRCGKGGRAVAQVLREQVTPGHGRRWAHTLLDGLLCCTTRKDPLGRAAMAEGKNGVAAETWPGEAPAGVTTATL